MGIVNSLFMFVHKWYTHTVPYLSVFSHPVLDVSSTTPEVKFSLLCPFRISLACQPDTVQTVRSGPWERDLPYRKGDPPIRGRTHRKCRLCGREIGRQWKMPLRHTRFTDKCLLSVLYGLREYWPELINTDTIGNSDEEYTVHYFVFGLEWRSISCSSWRSLTLN